MIYLSAVVVLFCFLHRKEAFAPVVAMVAINSIHSLVGPYLPSVAYYVTAGTLDAVFIAFICLFYHNKEFALDLCILALLSVACNLVGFLMYNAYLSPYLYNSASIIIMMLQLLRLLVKRNDGNTPGGRRLSLVRLHPSNSLQSNHGKDCQKEGNRT